MNLMKVTVKKGFSGYLPKNSKSQMENAHLSRTKLNMKDFWMMYHDHIHTLIYSEFTSNISQDEIKLSMQKSSEKNEDQPTIFMPPIFELNCQSVLIHDFSSQNKPGDYYGFSYSLISNQFLLDSFPENEADLNEFDMSILS